MNIYAFFRMAALALLVGLSSPPGAVGANYVSLHTDKGQAPAFTLPDLDNTPVSLSDFHGSVRILLFWTTW